MFIVEHVDDNEFEILRSDVLLEQDQYFDTGFSDLVELIFQDVQEKAFGIRYFSY